MSRDIGFRHLIEGKIDTFDAYSVCGRSRLFAPTHKISWDRSKDRVWRTLHADHRKTERREKVAREKRPGMYGDGGGLYLHVGKTGTRSWLFRFWVPARDLVPATAPPSLSVLPHGPPMSALPPKSGHWQTTVGCRFVPMADIGLPDVAPGSCEVVREMQWRIVFEAFLAAGLYRRLPYEFRRWYPQKFEGISRVHRYPFTRDCCHMWLLI